MKWLLIALLLSSAACAAVIEGSIYDLGLNELDSAVVEVNTTPAQRVVARGSSYSFEVPPGAYVLNATIGELYTSEVVVVGGEGSYTLDLILLPELETGLLNDFEVPEVEPLIQDSPGTFGWLGGGLLFVVLAYIVYMLVRKEKHRPESDDNLKRIMDYLKQQGGRASQKEIRNLFPYSEAKVSLMISELEAKGLVERFKKGRSNIIVKK